MSELPTVSIAEAGDLPAHGSTTLQRFPDLQPLTRAERKVIVAIESKDFRACVLRRLRLAGYHSLTNEPRNLLDMEPVFDANQTVICFVETSSDKELLHRLLRNLYQQWSEQGRGLVFVFWPPDFNDSDTFRIFGLEGSTWPAARHQFASVSRLASSRDEETITELLFQMTCYP